MLTRDDLIDLIVSHLLKKGTLESAAPAPNQAPKPKAMPRQGRRFISEYDLRKMIRTGEARIVVPQDAILSPLALDWLVLKGIAVDRE